MHIISGERTGERRVIVGGVLVLGLVLAGLLSTYGAGASVRVPPPAPAGVTRCSDVITNGGFETGDLSGWGTIGSPSIDGSLAYASTYSGVVGGRDNAGDTFHQAVELPASVTSAFGGLTLESIVYTAKVNGLYRAKVIAKER